MVIRTYPQVPPDDGDPVAGPYSWRDPPSGHPSPRPVSAVVLAAGEAGGTIKGTEWHTPAAWKVVVRDGRVAEWRVFADNKPVYEILASR